MSSPSPPRAIPLRRSSSGLSVPRKRVLGLQRSQSALAFGSLPQPSVAVSYPPRLPAGRSRDVRSWQFACDTEARDELTTQAENESSGSAVAAISLLRSTGKSTLKSNGNKRNASPAKHDASVQGKKPRLREAHLSHERLQSTENSKPQISKGMLGLMHSPSGDSDKENWVPQEMEGNVRRRPLPSGRQDKQMTATLVLGDSVNPTTCLAKISGSRNRRRKAVNAAPKIFEDQENSGEFCEEVKEFMCKEVSPSKRGEFEGAQALLAMMGGGSWR